FSRSCCLLSSGTLLPRLAPGDLAEQRCTTGRRVLSRTGPCCCPADPWIAGSASLAGPSPFLQSAAAAGIVASMSDVTRILSAIEQGDPSAAAQLLPLVYDELRQLAAQKLAQEKPGQTLQATALVHEAYLRLVASPGREVEESEPHWDSRGHFFAAAAEAMRRILVDAARRKRSL